MTRVHLEVVLRWLWLLILFPIITTGVTYIYVAGQPTIYEAETLMIIGPGIDSPNPDLDALRTGAQLMQTYAELPKTDEILESIITDLALNVSKQELADMINITPLVDTQILKIAVRNENPDTALAVANLIAEKIEASGPSTDYITFLLERMWNQADNIEQNILDTESHLAELKDQLEIESDPAKQNLIIQQITEAERQLSNANTTLATLYDTLQKPVTNRVQIIDEASDAVALGSQLTLYLVIALGAGIAISGLMAPLLILIESALVNISTLRNLTDIPVWGEITPEANKNAQLIIQSKGKSSVVRQYQTLSSQLLYRHDFKELRSVLFININRVNHMPEVVSNLAVTLGKTDKTLLLVDTDPDNHFVDHAFDVESDSDLFSALNDPRTLSEFPRDDRIPNLKLLPSGAPSSESFNLIATGNMFELIQAMDKEADMVLFIAPPLATDESSLVLASRVDSVVLVANNRRTLLSKLNAAVAELETVGAHISGIVVVKTGRLL
jgi:capsular polysaccharide biosynthesis protein